MDNPINPNPAYAADSVTSTERDILGILMLRPVHIVEVRAMLQPEDFADPFHGRLFKLLCQLTDEGRTASANAVLQAWGNDELAPGVTLQRYLAHAMTAFGPMPLKDSIETVRDASMRRRIESIGSRMAAFTKTGASSIEQIATEAVMEIDTVMSMLRTSKPAVHTVDDVVEAAIQHIQNGEDVNPTTGLKDLDWMLGGWPRAQLSIIAGRPGMAKSAVATTMFRLGVANGQNHRFFSLEMTKEQMGARLLTDAAYIRQDPIYYDNLMNHRDNSDKTMERLLRTQAAMKGLGGMIEVQRGVTLADIIARSRKAANDLARKNKTLDVLWFDHIGLIRPSGRYAGNRVREVAEISDGLATLAKDLDCAVVGMCQLNRGVEGRDSKRPTLSDLRDSGAIEEDASSVMFVYRPAYYLERAKYDNPEDEQKRLNALAEERHTLELLVSKNRNGRVGTVNAWIDIGANAIRNKDYGNSAETYVSH